EGLLVDEPRSRGVRRLGFRTVMPFAEVIDVETDAFVCGSELFDGRHPRNETAWTSLYERFAGFVASQQSYLSAEHEVLLDCHTSGALAAGYLFTTRAAVCPLGPRPQLEPQKPSSTAQYEAESVWEAELHDLGQGPDLAIAVSVTHRTCHDVLEYVRKGDGI